MSKGTTLQGQASKVPLSSNLQKNFIGWFLWARVCPGPRANSNESDRGPSSRGFMVYQGVEQRETQKHRHKRVRREGLENGVCSRKISCPLRGHVSFSGLSEQSTPNWAASNSRNPCLLVLETASPRSRCGPCQLPPKAPVKDAFLGLRSFPGLGSTVPVFKAHSPNSPHVLVSAPNSQGVGQTGSGDHPTPASSPLN